MKIIRKSAAHILVQRILKEKGFSIFKPKSNEWLLILSEVHGEITPIEPAVLLPIVLKCYRMDAKKYSLEAIIANTFENEPDFFRAYLEMILEPFEGTYLDNSETTTHLFFKKGVLSITAGDLKKIEYKDLSAYVWNRPITDHELGLR